jgi:hypothetical protein
MSIGEKTPDQRVKMNIKKVKLGITKINAMKSSFDT